MKPGRRPELARLRAADPKLGRLIDRIGPLDTFRFFQTDKLTPFAALAHSVTHQQLGGAAAEAIFGRLKKTLGGRLSAEKLMAARPQDLRAAGLSASKVLSLKDLAGRTMDGTVPTRTEILRLPDDEIIERLTSIRGIGRWTVEMLLLKLGRPDILPATDLGIRRGYGAVFGSGALAHPNEILHRGERWRPFRSTASFYLWRAS
jgi:3-methyladenine DNA glycosylase/8-oxoguanine DNA glycosylase